MLVTCLSAVGPAAAPSGWADIEGVTPLCPSDETVRSRVRKALRLDPDIMLRIPDIRGRDWPAPLARAPEKGPLLELS